MQQQQIKKERSANIELLRILAMFLIVFGHSAVHGTARAAAGFLSADYFAVWSIMALTQCGVDIFILITGYFLSAQEKTSFARVLPIAKQTWFYSISIFFILFALGAAGFSLRTGLHVFFPIITYSYWFITLYILLVLLSPVFNILLRLLGDGLLKFLLVCGMIIYTLWVAFIIVIPPPFDIMGHLVWFVYLYFAGAYLRRAYKPDYKPFKFLAAYFICCALLLGGKTLVAAALPSWHSDTSIFVYKNYCFLTFFSAVSLLLAFLNIKIKDGVFKKAILWAAPSALAIYLITEQFLLRPFIWHNMLGGQVNYHGFALAGYLFAGSLAVFAAAFCIDAGRRFIVSKGRKDE